MGGKTANKIEEANKRKGIGAQRVKHPTTSLATNALIGDEEQNGKQKKQGAQIGHLL